MRECIMNPCTYGKCCLVTMYCALLKCPFKSMINGECNALVYLPSFEQNLLSLTYFTSTRHVNTLCNSIAYNMKALTIKNMDKWQIHILLPLTIKLNSMAL